MKFFSKLTAQNFFDSGFTKKARAFIFLFLVLLPKPLLAQTIDSMYYSWVVYEIDENTDNKRCYIASIPSKSDTSYTAPRVPYLAVTRYEKTRAEEISLYSGYEYKISSTVYLLIGDKQKYLFTKDDMAWAKSDTDDKEIINFMLNNNFVKARSDSSVGNYAIDEYELKGFVRAYARMKELCK